MSDSTQIEVKILSYERWDSLERLLASLTNLRSEGFTFCVEVIDNSETSPLSPSRIRKIAENYGAGYHRAGLKNIAAARNVALSRTHAGYLAFIDDDEIATPDWLAALFSEMERTESDVVFGQSVPRLRRPKSWLKQADNFRPGFVESTANCLLRMRPLREARMKFDEHFGKCGGSDFEFFTRLRCLSFRFAYAEAAITFENFDQSRTSARWVARRAFRCGGSRGAVLSKYQKNQYAQEIVGATKGILKVFSLFSRAPLGNRFWKFFFYGGLLFFSLCGRVLSEYESGRFRFARFSHSRWSFLEIYCAHLHWRSA